MTPDPAHAPAQPKKPIAIDAAGAPNQTADLYGPAYQRAQAEKYRNRAHNHWAKRIGLAFELADAHVLPRFAGRSVEDIRVVDVGCSIGTFAIEFARRGHTAIGVDFDPDALDMARALAAEEGVACSFLEGDIADLSDDLGAIDVAVCFDIFEHLLDDQLGVLLHTLRRALSPDGAIVFQTFPTQYDYLFHTGDRPGARALRHFTGLDPEAFARLTTAYAHLHDAMQALATGRDQAHQIERAPHCNPLTQRRLEGLLTRAGLRIDHIETADLYGMKPGTAATFGAQPIAQRNLFGVASSQRSTRPLPPGRTT